MFTSRHYRFIEPALTFACCLSAFGALAAAANTPAAINLAGKWRYALDRADAGVSQAWYNRVLDGTLRLPGSLPGQGIGDPVSTNTPWVGGIMDKSFFTAPEFEKHRQPGQVKVPFWLQPRTYYKGVAWYQRDIEIPEAWKDKRVVLSLERPHWETRVWLDGRFLGANDSLSTPHECALGVDLPPGEHRLTIRVDNRMAVDIGENSHSISDHTQGNWNGIVGKIELRAGSPVWVDELQVYPHLARQSVRLRGRIGNLTGQAGQGTLQVRVDEAVERGTFNPPPLGKVPVAWEAEGGTFECEFKVSGAKAWDEFQTPLYNAEAWIEPHQEVMDAKVALFGFRDFAADGTQFTINGRKTFLRGTLECAIFPKTGHTPTDIESWRKLIKAAKAHGLNNLRFHSHCPPEAAFVAADELGMYLHVECGTWPNMSTTLGDGKPVDDWLYRETDRILKAYGNHPSFVILLHGNEPGGNNHTAFLKKWVDYCKAKDPRRLYSSGAGWPQIPENQLHVTPDPRIMSWGGGLNARINAKPPETVTDYRDYIAARQVPVVSHEIGEWCVYPNFDEIKKYTGYLKPRNFEIFRDSLKAHGMFDQARDFLRASGKLQTLCYKEDIESALRTPGMAGFQLLDLHDFPGQGTALVGVLDPFWEGKGYVTAEEYRRFCDATVPLARLKKRVFTTDETLTAELDVAHFGPVPLKGVAPTFKLVGDDGKIRYEGQLSAQDIPLGNGTKLSPLNLDLHGLPAPGRYKLVIGLTGTPAANDWDFWVYPPEVSSDVPAGVTVVNDLDEAAVATLVSGGKVLWLLPPNRVKKAAKDPVLLGFSSIFWNTAWTSRQAPTTLGILCDPKHPLFAQFPSDFHSNWQWWYLITRAGAMILDDLPKGLRPTVQVIDDWVTNRKLGLVFEAKVDKGRLAVCSVDLANGLATNLVARQFRRSLLDYVAGEKFRPKTAITIAEARSLVQPPSLMQRLGASVRASSEQRGHEAAMAIDGNPATTWHTFWDDPKPDFPHELVIELGGTRALRGLNCLPRQDGNPNGWIKDYAVFVSSDGQTWGEPVAKGEFARDARLKDVWFTSPVSARFVKLVALSGHANGPWASVAEIELIPAGN